jgi:GNAT superfamily N-acetyltransferase
MCCFEKINHWDNKQITLKVKEDQSTVGIVKYQVLENTLQVKWIEIYEKYQHQGYGSATLDYLAKLAISKKYQFEISVVDEALLNTFYFKWFQSWEKRNSTNPKMTKALFSQLVIEGVNPILRLLLEKPFIEQSSSYPSADGFN